MESVPPCPTNMAALPRLLSDAHGLELEQRLFRAKRGVLTLASYFAHARFIRNGRPRLTMDG